ncbi:IS200/IS605 family accessory protein TnpB-related protein [Nitrospira sp. Kam-Ns4a]
MAAQRTYQTRLVIPPKADSLLGAYAELYGHVQRTLFAAMARGESPESLKPAYLQRFGLTARQFNAICHTLKGMVSSIKERRKGLIQEARTRINTAEKRLAALDRRHREETDATQRACLAKRIHQKKRRLAILRHRLARLEDDHAHDRVRICFGSRPLFRAQFHLKEHGYASLDEWRTAWRRARASQFFVLGSKDETAGCQGCVAEYLGHGRFAFRLRLPDAVIAANGGEKFLRVEATLPYGTEHVVAALARQQAISYRFVRDAKGWRVFISTGVLPVRLQSDRRLGVIGLDLNNDHLAVTETDRHGNPCATAKIPLVTYGCSREQAQARIGEAVKQVMAFARGTHKPLAFERLAFARKKAQLEGNGVRYRRMLSALSYARILAILKARAHDAGLEVLEVNPAYTSVIGRHKFARRYGLSTHQAAALCLARRALNYSERPNRRMSDQVAFSLPVRNRDKHVWSFWRQVARKEAALAAPRWSGMARSCRSPAGRSGKAPAAILPASAGGIPARESSSAPFG